MLCRVFSKICCQYFHDLGVVFSWYCCVFLVFVVVFFILLVLFVLVLLLYVHCVLIVCCHMFHVFWYCLSCFVVVI